MGVANALAEISEKDFIRMPSSSTLLWSSSPFHASNTTEPVGIFFGYGLSSLDLPRVRAARITALHSKLETGERALSNAGTISSSAERAQNG